MNNEVPNQDVINALEDALRQAKDSTEPMEVYVLVRIGDEYHRFSSGITNTLQLVATLELVKFDALNRMIQ